MVKFHLGIPNTYASDVVVDAARRAEAAGVTGVWISDIRFWRDCYVLATAIAERTSEIEIGSSVSDVYSRHPIVLAAIASTLDEIAPGRICIGIGAGGSSLAEIGAVRRGPVGTVRGLAHALRSLTTQESCSIEAAGFVVHDGRQRFGSRPVQIAMAASGPRMYELAGSEADVTFVGRYIVPGAIKTVQECIAKGERTRNPALSPTCRQVLRLDVSVCNESPDAAFDVMRSQVTRLLGAGYRSEAFLGPMDMLHLLPKERELTKTDTDAVVNRVSLWGSESGIAEQLATLMTKIDISEVSLSPYPVPGQSFGQSVEGVLRVMRELHR